MPRLAPSRRTPRRGAPPAANWLAAALLAAPLLAPLPGTARAQPAGPATVILAPGQIGLELNRLEPQPSPSAGAGCRAWLVLRNPGEEAVDPLRLDLLLFGKDGVIARRLALDVGPLPGSKTMARIFDLSALPCEQIGAMLLNDLLACGPTPEGRAACLPRIITSSRVAGVGFDK